MWNILSVQYNGASIIIGLDFHEKLKNAKKKKKNTMTWHFFGTVASKQ
jgi:hypothetical protein